MNKSQSTIRSRPMRNRKTASKTRRFGTTTVEMAIVAPFIFLLVFSSIEFSRMMMVRQSLTNAAREGCRHACLATTTASSDAKSTVRDRLQGVITGYNDPQVVRVQVTPTFTAVPATGQAITTVVEVDCEDVSFLPPFFFSGAKITGRASMNRE